MKIKISISLILLTLFCGVSVFSQDIKAEQSFNVCECEQISSIKDKELDFSVGGATLSEFLNYISAETGVTFVIDPTIKNVKKRVVINKVSWKKALDVVLRLNSLKIIVECPILRIAKIEEVKEYSGCEMSVDKSVDKVDVQSLYTKLINYEESNLDAYNVITENVGGLMVAVDEDGEFYSTYKGPSNLEKIVSKMLPNNPSFNGDETGRYLIITESKSRLQLFNKFIEILKRLPRKRRMCGLTAIRLRFSKEYQDKLKEENRVVTEKLTTQNIFSSDLSNDNSKSQVKWIENQEELARTILKDLEIDAKMLDSGLEITTTNKKMRFVKDIISLFDKQILEEK